MSHPINFKKCPKCQEEIGEGAFIATLGNAWHFGCAPMGDLKPRLLKARYADPMEKFDGWRIWLMNSEDSVAARSQNEAIIEYRKVMGDDVDIYSFDEVGGPIELPFSDMCQLTVIPEDDTTNAVWPSFAVALLELVSDQNIADRIRLTEPGYRYSPLPGIFTTENE